MKNLEMSKDYINPDENMLLTYLPGNFYRFEGKSSAHFQKVKYLFRF